MDNPSTPPESSPAQQVRRAVVVGVKRALRAAGPAGRRTARALTAAHRAWRRSLQLRMGLITLVLSGSLVAGFGLLVADRNTTAQIDGVRQATREQLRLGAEYARDQLANYQSPGSAAANQQIKEIVNQLKITPEQGGGVVVAMLDESGQATDAVYPDKAPVDNAISSGLHREVAVNHKVASQIVSADIGQNGTRTYLVYGTPVPTRWGYLELYYFQPMDNAESITSDFRTSMALLGFFLVALLVLVVMLVTRLVVNPIRIAARTAQRLSAGLLDQRMDVRGEDDLAMLASSFNQMAASLQRQIVRLEEMSRLQRRFTSDVSHELRTPLTTVRMAADLLHSERDTFDPAVARSAELLQHELDRFENLLSDLLEISRFDAGFAMLDAEPTDLGPIVLRVVDRLESVAERAGVEVEIAVPETPVIAEVDPRRIERVLRNLIGNAVEHAEGRPVVVTLGVDEHAAAVTVRDHGIGLKPGEEKLVFNRFWRADPSRARQTGGTGLGLSIALEDARLHGGWLEAWGEPGQGAQFRITLPVRAGDRLTSSPLPLMPSGTVTTELLDSVPPQVAGPSAPAHPAGVA
ncbi:MAG: HAMP domain-containing histidine kinase [Hamadaea sp.]|uniref:MtrAB system histidine kinase MtrB n=1 Tax=Hamadaea sp. TaxID=2024425 RepID=UPI0017B7A2D9|nr:MtrAB system histidine kinase MtrB [Hamadaea sp.]NUR70753.1 HAMP domain-containing histidine kinase [Hamadaea sp.]NUT23933.1 HAMP domain-containing histidine kinase [Hamadaea sp.]